MTNETFALSSLPSDCGVVSQTHRHVERPLQPRHTQELPGHRDGLQRGPVQ